MTELISRGLISDDPTAAASDNGPVARALDRVVVLGAVGAGKTLRDFRDRATEMMRSHEVLLVTRDGKPAGFFLPWDRPDVPDDVRKGIYAELSGRALHELDEKGVGGRPRRFRSCPTFSSLTPT